LTGPGGVGKTRLALDVLHTVAGDYPDGAVFVDLAPLRDPRLVITAIGRAFGLDERDPVPVQDRLRAALRERRALLLADNFEHLTGAAADLVALLTGCPQWFALVTSRVPLRGRGDGEHRIAPPEF